MASGGGSLDRWEVRAVHSRPGAETSVGYDAIVQGQPQYLIASTAALTSAEREAVAAVRLDSELGAVHVWAHPADPRLPGLATVCDRGSVAVALEQVVGAPVEVTSVELLVHRPLRRAVARVKGRVQEQDRTWFVKALRLDRADDVAARHALLAGGLGPQTTYLGDGVLILDQAQGRSVASTMATTEPDRQGTVIDPARYVEALEAIPAAATNFPHRGTPAEKVHKYATSAVNRGLDADRAHALAAQIERICSQRDPGDTVATHGDFNVANIFVSQDADGVDGMQLIDVDTLGPGYRIDDLACLVAHLAVLPALDARLYSRVADHVEAVIDYADTRVDPVGLRTRAGAVVLSLAAGCPDDARAVVWFDLACDVVERAEAMMRDLS